jgi:hypothetical protein
MFMKRFIVVAVLIAAAIAIFQLAYPSVTIRYRLTLEVDADGKPATRSGVVEVTYRRIPRLLSASASLIAEARGDAISIAIGPSTVLALLAPGNDRSPEDIIPVLFGVPRGEISSDNFSRIRALSGTRNLPPELLPPLVRLDDPHNPSTATLVGPSSLGFGASLRSASIEIVDPGHWPLTAFGVSGVPVTREIEKTLPWVTSQSGSSMFWKALYSSGFRSDSSVEVKMLLTRG